MARLKTLDDEIERVKKGLAHKDLITSRWSYGYLDGLEYARKLLEKEKCNGGK